jgi:hypothetical protein
VRLRLAAELSAAIGEHTAHHDLVLVEEQFSLGLRPNTVPRGTSGSPAPALGSSLTDQKPRDPIDRQSLIANITRTGGRRRFARVRCRGFERANMRELPSRHFGPCLACSTTPGDRVEFARSICTRVPPPTAKKCATDALDLAGGNSLGGELLVN